LLHAGQGCRDNSFEKRDWLRLFITINIRAVVAGRRPMIPVIGEQLGLLSADEASGPEWHKARV